jgi:hypothetical protein
MEILPYVYMVKNKVTDEYYIGSRKANVGLKLSAEEDLFIKYFTSGKLKEDIKSNINNYEYKILMEYGDEDVVFWYEQLMIREHIDDELNMNGNFVDPDTAKDTFWGKKGQVGRVWSEEQKIKKSLQYKDKPKPKEFVEKITKYMNSEQAASQKENCKIGVRRRSESGVPWAHKGKPWSEARRLAQNRRKSI